MWLEWGPAHKQPPLLFHVSAYTSLCQHFILWHITVSETHTLTPAHTHTHMQTRARFNGRAVKRWTAETLPGEKCDDGLLAAALGWVPAIHVKPCKPSRCVYAGRAHKLVCVYEDTYCTCSQSCYRKMPVSGLAIAGEHRGTFNPLPVDAAPLFSLCTHTHT